MSECKPESLEEAYSKKPEPPALPPAEELPEPPAPETVPNDMMRDPDAPGTLANTDKQVKALERELAALEQYQKDLEAGKVTEGAPKPWEPILEQARDQAREGVRQTDFIIAKIDQAIEAAQRNEDSYRRGTAAAGNEFFANARSAVETINRLASLRGDFQDVRSVFSGISDLAEKAGLDPELAHALTSLGGFASAVATGNPVAAVLALGSGGLGKENTEAFVNSVQGVYNTVATVSRGLETGDFGSVLSAIEQSLPAEWNEAIGNVKKVGAEVGKFAAMLGEKLDDAAWWLNEASRYLDFAITFLRAACRLIEAIKQLFSQLMWLMANMDALLSTLVLNLIPQRLTFKLPKQPGFLLRAVDGLVSRFVGLEGVGKCLTKAFGGNPGDEKSPTEEIPSFEKIWQDALAFLAKAAGDAIGIKLNNNEAVIENPFAFARNAWKDWSGLNKISPQAPVVLPEEGAILSVLNQAVALVAYAAGFVSELFKPGVGPVQPADMAQTAVGPNGEKVAVHPHPANSIANQIRNTRAHLQMALNAAQRAKKAQELGILLRQRAAGKITNAKLAAELTAQIGQTALSTNMLRDANLDNLIPAARDHFACEAKDKQLPDKDGIPQGLVQPSEVDLKKEFAEVLTVSPVLPYSTADLLKNWHPKHKNDATFNTEKAYNDLDSLIVRDEQSDTVKKDIGRYARPEGPTDFDQLPFSMLMNSTAEYERWNRLKRVYDTLKQADAALHARVLSKANAQGLQATSPFTFLAVGLQAVQGFDLLEAVQHFLRHDYRHDLKAFEVWARSAKKVDEKVARPQDLEPDETRAAEESARFWQAYKDQLEDLPAFIIALRQRSDELGGPASYELFAMLAAMLVLKRVQYAYERNRPEAEVRALAKKGQALLKYVSHPSNLDEAFRVFGEMD